MNHILKIIVWWVLVCLQALLFCGVNESGVAGPFPQEPISFTLWWPKPTPIILISSQTHHWSQVIEIVDWSPSHYRYQGKNVNTKIKYASGSDNGSHVSSSFWISSRFINTLQIMSFIIIRGIVISPVVKQLQWIMTEMFP